MKDFQAQLFERFLAEWNPQSKAAQVQALRRALVDGNFCCLDDVLDDESSRRKRELGISKDLLWKLGQIVDLYPNSPTECLKAARLECVERRLATAVFLPRDVGKRIQAEKCSEDCRDLLRRKMYRRFIELNGEPLSLEKEVEDNICAWKDEFEENEREGGKVIATAFGCISVAGLVCLLAVIGILRFLFFR